MIGRYRDLLSSGSLPPKTLEKLARIVRDEEEHETSWASRIEEWRVKYLGSLALGMSDAIIELSCVSRIRAGEVGAQEVGRARAWR